MSFEIKVYKDSRLPDGAEIALKSRLYIIGWCLYTELKRLKAGKGNKGQMAIGFLDGQAVCVVVHNTEYIQAFCRKAVRGKGYASACVAMLETTGTEAQEGVKGSMHFWRKAGIICTTYQSRYATEVKGDLRW